MLVLLLLTFTTVLLVYTYFTKKLNYWNERGVEHRKPHIIFGSLYECFTKKLSIIETIVSHYNEFKHKRFYGMYSLHKPIFMVSDLELIKDITVKSFDHFIDHQNHAREDVDPLWSRTLFAKLGNDWHNMRSVLSPAFTGSKMRFMFPLLDECARSFADYFSAKDGNIFELEMKAVLTKATNDMIATAAFGIKCDSLRHPENDFYVIGRKALTFDGLKRFYFFLYDACPKLLKLFGAKIFNDDIVTFFRQVIKQTIKQREDQKIIRPDIIHLMLECRKGQLTYEDDNEEESFSSAKLYKLEAKSKKAINLSDEDITAQALIFFFGGMDTTSFLLTFLTYELALNPDIQERLRSEIEESFEKNDGKLTYESLMRMGYMDMVISETLRKYPVAFFLDRKCTKEYVIEPVNKDERRVVLKKGTIVWIPVFGMHRDERFYPDPEKFDPERFNKENKVKIKPFTYMPFGSGPRNCIGSRFALMQTKCLICYLLRKIEIVPVKKTKIPFEICKNNTMLTCAGGMWLGFKKR